MRWLTAGLLVLLALLQYLLWFGTGGWLMVWENGQQLERQKETTRQLEQRNAEMEAEVRDLKQGYDAIEERARFELGMTRPDEDFIRHSETGARQDSLPFPASR
ncbi:MAG: cell division protein FtsB [Zoogloeaceae bacterium]|jgi:cell division protein FtsB|nr:cell division protein FtsB [Zoogloeaceae bacterium]